MHRRARDLWKVESVSLNIAHSFPCSIQDEREQRLGVGTEVDRRDDRRSDMELTLLAP